MRYARQKLLNFAAQLASAFITLSFVIAALAFFIHGLLPAADVGETVERRYKIIGEPFTLDWFFIEALGAGPGLARTFGHLTVAVACILIGYLFFLAFQVVRRVAAGRAFDEVNARRLRHVGWLILLPVAAMFAWRAIQLTPSFETALTFAFVIGAGVGLILFGRIVEEGKAINDDLEGTV